MVTPGPTTKCELSCKGRCELSCKGRSYLSCKGRSVLSCKNHHVHFALFPHRAPVARRLVWHPQVLQPMCEHARMAVRPAQHLWGGIRATLHQGPKAISRDSQSRSRSHTPACAKACHSVTSHAIARSSWPHRAHLHATMARPVTSLATPGNTSKCDLSCKGRSELSCGGCSELSCKGCSELSCKGRSKQASR